MNPKPSKALPKSEQKRLLKLVEFETRLRKQGFRRIAGVDEAGRGPLAGPVVAAACVIGERHFFPGINDSKLVPPPKRKALFQQLIAHPDVFYGIGSVDVAIIDKINILQATLQAMRQAIANLPLPPDYLLLDGVELAVDDIPFEKVIKGDTRSQSIAGASIIAKETRDQLMVEYHQIYPEYGFDQHKVTDFKKAFKP